MNADLITTTVPALRQIDPQRRSGLVQNPAGTPPAALNQQVPEINDIELDNAIAAGIPGSTLGFRQENFDGSKTLKIQPQSTSKSSATRRLLMDEPLGIAAWNLERGRHWREGVQLLQTHPTLRQLDVLFLSEMDNGMARTENAHTTRQLALALGMNYAYGVEFLELSLGTGAEQVLYRDRANALGYHGNAILSRFPLQRVRMVRFPGIEKWYGTQENRLGGRNALLAEIALGNQTITLVSTHLESGEADREIRDRQGQQLLEALDASASDHPVVIGGDFNSVPTAPVIQRFREAGFAVEAANDLSQSTYQEVIDGCICPGRNHIDYLLVRGLTIVPNSPAVIMAAYPWEPTGKLLSDHAIVAIAVQT